MLDVVTPALGAPLATSSRCRFAPEVLSELTRTFAFTAAKHDLEASVPTENFALLHRHGLLSATVPRSQGGAGASLRDTSELVRAIGRGEPATALIATMQFFAHQHALRSPQTDPASLAIRQRVQVDAVETGALLNSLRVEPALGTPQRGGLPDTVARRTNDGWVISGRKIYSTGAPVLRWLLVWARTDENEVRTGNFLVPAASAGVAIEETWNHIGLRASGSHDVVMTEVFVPLDHAIDLQPHAASNAFVQGTGQHSAAQQMAWLCALLGSIYDGVANEARDWLVTYLTERIPTNLGAPLSSLPRFQEAIGHIDSLLLTNRSLLDHLASAADADINLTTAQAGLVKFTVMDNAHKVVQSAVDLIGNPGLSRNNPLERHLRDVLCGRVHTPQPDAALSMAGRAAVAQLSR